MTGVLDLYLEIAGTLTVVSPLHTGSGALEPDDVIARAPNTPDGSNQPPPTSARVEHDAKGYPYIPGTGIKGALRAYAEQLGLNSLTALFGEPKSDGSGQKGALTVFGATYKPAPPQSALPHFDRLKSDKRYGRALSARTAVDAGRGTADHAKLFFAECVVPDTTFAFRLHYRPPLADTNADEALRQLLAALQNGDITLGRGTADGDGRVRLNEIKAKKVQVNTTTGDLTRLPDTAFLKSLKAPERPGLPLSLTLTGDGPYFVQDWTFKPKRDPDSDDPPGPQVRALADHSGRPALPGTSLMGAMRSRASWLAQTTGAQEAVIDELFGAGPDSASGALKARLMVEGIVCKTAGQRIEMTSVKLDRFSGGPIDGGLFTTACVADPVFVANLRLHSKASKEARAFLIDVLMTDLHRNGIRLGHSGARGFGWFNVSGTADHLREAGHVR